MCSILIGPYTKCRMNISLPILTAREHEPQEGNPTDPSRCCNKDTYICSVGGKIKLAIPFMRIGGTKGNEHTYSVCKGYQISAHSFRRLQKGLDPRGGFWSTVLYSIVYVLLPSVSMDLSGATEVCIVSLMI